MRPGAIHFVALFVNSYGYCLQNDASCLIPIRIYSIGEGFADALLGLRRMENQKRYIDRRGYCRQREVIVGAGCLLSVI